MRELKTVIEVPVVSPEQVVLYKTGTNSGASVEVVRRRLAKIGKILLDLNRITVQPGNQVHTMCKDHDEWLKERGWL